MTIYPNLVHLLNQSVGIVNETMYHEILRSFNLEVKQVGKGADILVTDNEGTVIRNPLRMSDLKEGIDVQEISNSPDKESVKQVEAQVTAGFKALFNKYRFCDALTAAQELKEKGLFLFRSSESGTFRIFSADHKMVFNNPFLMDKQLIRLYYFNMTNKDFFDIIKDYNRVLSEKFPFISAGLIDYNKVSVVDLKNHEKDIPLKEIKLSESKEFVRLTSGMDDLSRSFTESAIKDYYRYSIRRIIETEQRINQYDFYREYNQNRKSFKPGLTNELSDKYKLIKTDDQYYLNNHPAGIQAVNINPDQSKVHLNAKNFFSTSLLDMLRLLPWHTNEKLQRKKKKMLKQKRKGQGRRL